MPAQAVSLLLMMQGPSIASTVRSNLDGKSGGDSNPNL